MTQMSASPCQVAAMARSPSRKVAGQRLVGMAAGQDGSRSGRVQHGQAWSGYAGVWLGS